MIVKVDQEEIKKVIFVLDIVKSRTKDDQEIQDYINEAKKYLMIALLGEKVEE